MLRRKAHAKAQTISGDHAASFVQSGMWLEYGAALCQPATEALKTFPVTLVDGAVFVDVPEAA